MCGTTQSSSVSEHCLDAFEPVAASMCSEGTSGVSSKAEAMIWASVRMSCLGFHMLLVLLGREARAGLRLWCY